MGLESYIYRNIRNFFIAGFFNFLSSENFLKNPPEIQEVFLKISISWNIIKAFFWENTRNSLVLGIESSISQNIRKMFFWENVSLLGLKCPLGSFPCSYCPLLQSTIRRFFHMLFDIYIFFWSFIFLPFFCLLSFEGAY